MGKFSGDNLIEETDFFSQSIVRLGESTWKKILEEGNKQVPVGSRRSAAAQVVVRVPVVERHLIQDDPDSEPEPE